MLLDFRAQRRQYPGQGSAGHDHGQHGLIEPRQSFWRTQLVLRRCSANSPRHTPPQRVGSANRIEGEASQTSPDRPPLNGIMDFIRPGTASYGGNYEAGAVPLSVLRTEQEVGFTARIPLV